MIKIVLFDIDGVLTDSCIIVDENGKEWKQISLRDVDAVYELKKLGFKIGAITGENTNITNYFEKRFPWDFFYRGCKRKLEMVKEIEKRESVNNDEICYVGDSKYDLELMGYVGLSVCPCDAILPIKEKANLILGESCHGWVWELLEYLKTEMLDDDSSFFKRIFFEHYDMFKKILADKQLQTTIIEFGRSLIDSLQNGKQLLLFGNGGSASDAQHIASEFVGRFYKERKAIKAEALTANASSITAIGNDYAFENIFARQIEAKCSPGDVLLGITTSGTSKNILRGLDCGKKIGAITVLFTGERVRNYDYVDVEVNVPSGLTPRIQEGHIFLGHLLCEYVEENLLFF
jgi:D-sedoheptulose 7-phosphate isomerase